MSPNPEEREKEIKIIKRENQEGYFEATIYFFLAVRAGIQSI